MSNELRAASKKFIESGKLILKENILVLTKEGKLLLMVLRLIFY
mgnify:CR=1 FL=1